LLLCTPIGKGRHCPKELPVYPDGINEQGWRQEQKLKLSQGFAELELGSSALSEVPGLQLMHRKNKAVKIRNGSS